MRTNGRVATVLSVLVLVTGVLHADAAYGQQAVRVTNASPVEAKLAAIDLDQNPVPRAAVRRYGVVLDDLAPRCVQSRNHTADILVGGQRELRRRYGKRMTILELGRAFVTMMRESGLREQDCSEALTLLVITLGGSGG